MSQSFYDRVTNSKFYDLGDKLGDIIKLSFFWLICSIPIVTCGPASSALYYAIHKRFKNGSETPGRDYWHSFKDNLGQGILLTVIVLLYAGITGFNIFFAWKGWNGIHMPSWYLPVSILLLLPLIFSVPYIFPYIARFKNTTRNSLFHSFTFATMYAGHTLVMWLFMLLSLAIMIAFFPSMLFLPFTCCYLCWRKIERDFEYALIQREKREHPERFQNENEEEDDDEYEYDEDEDEDDDESDPDDEEDDEDEEEDVEDSDESDEDDTDDEDDSTDSES